MGAAHFSGSCAKTFWENNINMGSDLEPHLLVNLTFFMLTCTFTVFQLTKFQVSY